MCPPVSSSRGETPLAKPAKQQQLRSRRYTMQVMPSEQGGSDSRNAECRALGKQDFELLLSEEMAEL